MDKLIIFEGTNDIGCCGGNYEHVTDTLIACYKVLIAKAKAKGIKVYGGTITPTKGNGWYSFWHINGNGLTTREYVLGSSMHTASDLIAFRTIYHPGSTIENALQGAGTYTMVSAKKVNGAAPHPGS